MKSCYKCKVDKDESEFHKNKRRSDGLQNYCKDCAKTRNREYYLATPERNSQRRESTDRARKISREYVWSYLKQHSCVDCGESDIVVLEFDHVRGIKEQNISFMVTKGYGLDAIKEEMLKCEVRCANCHRRVTARRGEWAIVSY